MPPPLTVHVLPLSHPCLTVVRALELQGLAFERVDLVAGAHGDEMERIYGARTVPGMLVGSEPVHGSTVILARIDELAGDGPALYPDPAVREAELWGDRELQDLGRRLPWGALHFRPEAMGTFGGAPPLDPDGTDFAIAYARSSWRYHGITAARLHADLQDLPAKLDHVDALAAAGTIGGEEANAADLQLGATLRVLLTLGDLDGLLAGRPGEQIARRWFGNYPGRVPPGAFPAGWVPARDAGD